MLKKLYAFKCQESRNNPKKILDNDDDYYDLLVFLHLIISSQDNLHTNIVKLNNENTTKY